MPFILSGSKFILSHNGKFTTSNRPYIEFVKGGTATGVAISFYNASLIAAYKEELDDLGPLYEWRFPSTGTAVYHGVYGDDMFAGCAGTRSSDRLDVKYGESKSYYTQNHPIQ